MKDQYDIFVNDVKTLLESPIGRCESMLKTITPIPLKGNDEPYQGGNAFTLALQTESMRYTSPYWVTFQQVKKQGGRVLKGKVASKVIFYKKIKDNDLANNEFEKTIIRYYSVFNLDATNLKIDNETFQYDDDFSYLLKLPKAIGVDLKKVNHNQPKFITDHLNVFEIQMPSEDRFINTSEFYATLLHESAHAYISTQTDYQKLSFWCNDLEELIVELAAFYLSYMINLGSNDNGHLYYLKHFQSKNDLYSIEKYSLFTYKIIIKMLLMIIELQKNCIVNTKFESATDSNYD